MPHLTFGSLFAGIGGFDLGFERAGMVCKWQVEIDEFCRRVLAKHWPDVRRHNDVETFPPGNPDDWRVDVICGGFPCQDISDSGNKLGIEFGPKSSLWFEFARIIRVVRPRIVVVENVSALLYRGMGVVLGDLAALGYDAEWSVLSACSMGAPHARERVFIIAYSHGCLLRTSRPATPESRATNLHLDRTGEKGQLGNWWAIQPEPCSVVYGIPGLVDRLRPYGNTIVPQVAELVGRRILEALPEQNYTERSFSDVVVND